MGIRGYYRRARRPQVTELSKALAAARRAARYRLLDLARAVRVHPRTVRRWEIGAAAPRRDALLRVVQFYRTAFPAVAAPLAAVAGVPAPPVAPRVDPVAAEVVIGRVADTLDVAPRRVREVLRAAAHEAKVAGSTVGALCAALELRAPGDHGS